MDIKEFIELCAGKWFSQRTSFQSKVESNKSEITVEFLDSAHPDIAKLCQQYRIEPEMALGGTKASWDNSIDSGQPRQTGHILLVWIPETDRPTNGKLLRYLSQGQSSLQGEYDLGTDEALSLSVGDEKHTTQERIWFASPNLRLRTSLVKLADRTQQTAFYSEIRKLS